VQCIEARIRIANEQETGILIVVERNALLSIRKIQQYGAYQELPPTTSAGKTVYCCRHVGTVIL